MRSVMESEHEMFRDSFRSFLEQEVVPDHEEWEEQGYVPKELWLKAGEMGYLCPNVPEEYGGLAVDYRYNVVILEEIARLNVTALGFTMHSDVVSLYLIKFGTESVKQNLLPQMMRGETIGALGMTEPSTGSDAKAIRTTAVREGNEYVINGSKTFITNGYNCGLVVLSCKTDPEAGRKGISLIVVEEGTPGFSKGRKLKKLGLPGQDTAELFFDNVRVPVENLLGEENKGFGYMMSELPQERMSIVMRAIQSIESMLDETIRYTKERQAFGKPVFEFQNSKFKLADAKAEADMLRTYADDCLAQHIKGELSAERAAMAKLVSTEMQNRLLDDFLQLHGGYGYMREYMVSRAWLDARVMRIYGGSSEIMREIISRNL